MVLREVGLEVSYCIPVMLAYQDLVFGEVLECIDHDIDTVCV